MHGHLRQALRSWRRTPALAAIIVLTLALGLGGTLTAFTLAYSVLVRPLPFPDPDRLVWITTHDSRTSVGGEPAINSGRYPLFADWQQNLTAFEELGAWAGSAPDVFTVTGAGTPERVVGLRVTHQVLPMLGGSPALGGLFSAGDDAPDAPQRVVLSHGYWQRRFAGQADVIGQSMTIENEPHTIAGVLSPDFPLSGSLFAGAPIDVYLPLTIEPDEDIGGFMAVMGRLRPGVTAEQASAELATRQAAMAHSKFPWMTVLGQRVTPLPLLLTRAARAPVLLLFAGTGIVLLLASANLANLLLMRASGRRRDMQIRAALGATMRQVYRQTLAESAVLVVAGTAAGVALAGGLTAIVRAAPWLTLARIGDLRIGWEAMAFAATVCAATTLVFGSMPLLHLRRRDAIDALRSHGGISTDRRAAHVQRFTLAAQVAFAVVLTVAAGLLLRSFAGLLDVDPGFNPRDAIAIRVDPAGRLPGSARLPFFDQVIERVRAVPGVDSAALTIHVPMGDRPSMGWDAIPEGQKADPFKDIVAGRIVSPGFFEAAGIRIVGGRDFDARDVRPNPFVMAINESFARRLRAEGRDPLEARFLVLGNVRQVVAVVADVKHRSLDADTGREAYIPIAQAPTFFQSYDLVMRAENADALVPAIREAIWSIDRDQALGTPVALTEYITRTLRPRRLLISLLGGFAVLALVLAALGVYGVVGYRVAQRTKELAIRVALGAPRWRVTTTVLRDTLAFVALGLAAGLPLALAAGGALRSYLFGVDARDPATLATALAVVTLAALLAACIPAQRAPRLDPISVLRAD